MLAFITSHADLLWHVTVILLVAALVWHYEHELRLSNEAHQLEIETILDEQAKLLDNLEWPGRIVETPAPFFGPAEAAAYDATIKALFGETGAAAHVPDPSVDDWAQLVLPFNVIDMTAVRERKHLHAVE